MKIHSLEELRAFAQDFVHDLRPRGSATVVALSGELGAGKTTFAQYVARELGVGETVTSPTFVIEKIYALEGQQFIHLIHIDAYRLKGAEELSVLGWEAVLSESGNLVLIEWPERVPELIPDNAVRIRFDIDGDARIITINGEGNSKKEDEKR